jgi:hypothetical protein
MRLAVAAWLGTLSLAAIAAPATASVTIGQLTPNMSTICPDSMDWAQPTVTSGNTYVVPPLPPASALVITSWSHHASSGAGQTLTMKVFRKVADPAFYMAVGHDGPRPLDAGLLNTFPVSIAVRPGDFLGLYTNTPDAGCIFFVPGETYLARSGNLADGEADAFLAAPGDRLNVSAVVAPLNSFSLGKVKRNKRKGTATLTVKVPNPGELALSGKGVKPAGAVAAKTVPAAGKVKLLIRARGKRKRRLNETGTVTVRPKLTYTPTGGDRRTRSRKLTLKKR